MPRADEEERLGGLADLPRWQDWPMIRSVAERPQAGDVTTNLTLAGSRRPISMN